MGKVKVDIYKQDFKYYNTSYSSIEDVYELLEKLDEIFFDAFNGSYEALVILLDLENLISEIDNEKHNKFMLEYLLIQTGKTPMKNCDCGKVIIKVLSERLNLDEEECEQLFLESINLIIENNHDKWLDFFYNNYFDKKVLVKKESKKLETKISDESYHVADYIKKYVNTNLTYDKDELPEDLQQFINYEKYNHNKIKELKIQLKTEGDKDKRKAINQEIRKRSKIKIDLCKDISILKEIYKIPIEKTNKKGKNIFYSYNENQDYIVDDDLYSVVDEVNIFKIKNIAKKILTDRQYIIFDLYYNVGLSQQKIAEIVMDDQRNITGGIKFILNKIKNNL